MKICTEVENLIQLQDEGYDLPSDDAYNFSPCYLAFVINTEDLSSDISVADYLELRAQELSEDNSIVFSVTSREPRYCDWLDAVSSIPGTVIYPTIRNLSMNTHYCTYLCIVPVTPRFEEV